MVPPFCTAACRGAKGRAPEMYTSLTEPVAGESQALWRELWLLLYLYSSSCRLPRRWEVRTPSTKLMASMRLLLPAPHAHAPNCIGHLPLQDSAGVA